LNAEVERSGKGTVEAEDAHVFSDNEKENTMSNLLLIIGAILVVLWLLGLVSSYTLGGFIHIALAIGLILVVVWIVTRLSRRRS
jgi:flagellar biogenesis protein FliO